MSKHGSPVRSLAARLLLSLQRSWRYCERLALSYPSLMVSLPILVTGLLLLLASHSASSQLLPQSAPESPALVHAEALPPKPPAKPLPNPSECRTEQLTYVQWQKLNEEWAAQQAGNFSLIDPRFELEINHHEGDWYKPMWQIASMCHPTLRISYRPDPSVITARDINGIFFEVKCVS